MRSSAYSLKNNKGIQGASLIKSTLSNHHQIVGNRKDDMGKTTKSNFQQTINNIKSKPNNKGLEDQYINGLQEEIKFLEYELKLLKDKEIMEREGVNQLDNFLKDQIPINQNILAIKNKYNATKSNLQAKLKQLIKKHQEATDVLQTQKNQIDRLHKLIDAHREQVDHRRDQFKNKISQLVRQLTLTKQEQELTALDNKKKQDQIKLMNEEVSGIQRANQKEKIQEVRAQEQKQKINIKFEEKTKQTKANSIESTLKVEEMEALGEINPLIGPLDQQNSNLRKKIMLNEKQKSTAENIISQIDLFLKEEEKQRQTQRQQKNKFIIAADAARNQFIQIQRNLDNLIKDKTIRQKKTMIKQMNIDIKEKQDLYDVLTDRLRSLEQQCSNLIQQKKQLKQALQSQTNTENDLKNRIDQTINLIGRNKSETDSLIRVRQQNSKEIPLIKNEVQRCKGMIPIVQAKIEKKKISIHHLNKQVDLLKELKTLDLEQLQLISQGGSHVQTILNNFMRNWEKIKSK